jgi:hypothetical protein
MEQMSGARRSGRLLARFEEVAGDNGGRMPLTQQEREVVDAVEGTRHEEGSVVAEQAAEAEEAKPAGEDPCTTTRELRSRSSSTSRYPSPREEKARLRDTRCHHRHLPRTWPT